MTLDFSNPVVADEFAMSAQKVEPIFKRIYKKSKKKYGKTVCFAGDGSFLCDYVLYAVFANIIKQPVFDKVIYLSDGNDCEYRNSLLDVTECEKASSDCDVNTGGIMFFADCTEGLSEKEKTLAKLKKALILARKNGVRCSVNILLPQVPCFPDEVTAVSERELDFYFEKVCEQTPEIEYFKELSKICRTEVRENDTDVAIVRFDNIFAPDRHHTPSVDIENIVESSFDAKAITINDEDVKTVTTVSYIREAVFDSVVTFFSAAKGHEYNANGQTMTSSAIKEVLFSFTKNEYSLNKTISPSLKEEYCRLNSMLIKARPLYKLRKGSTFAIGLKHFDSYFTGREYNCTENTDFYCGKIKKIQNLEFEILAVIDGICKKHGIKYFLAGGTLLGAVREGKAIPWDDDLDIGMLRDDYEKFREVCEKELPDTMSFSSPFNGSGSHYTIEKIRLNGTYFSTRYSSKNIFPDGIFVDILVYDNTSMNKVFRKIQCFLLALLYDSIIVKWYNKPRKKFHYRLTKFMLPILNLFPFGFYHGIFEFIVKWFRHDKKTTLLIDSVGKKLKDGPLPKEGLEETVYVDFEDTKAPIPVDPTGYLNYAYGPTYESMPVYGKRVCPHNFARIDLGKYIFDVKGKTSFRDIDLRGELYEKEDEV